MIRFVVFVFVLIYFYVLPEKDDDVLITIQEMNLHDNRSLIKRNSTGAYAED